MGVPRGFLPGRSSPRWAAIAAAIVACADPRRIVAAVPTVTGGMGDASTLFACGSSGDMAADITEILAVFKAAKAVCCDELEEQCDEKTLLPVTCATASCARIIDIVAQSCAAPIAADAMLGVTFKDPLDKAVSLCHAAAEDHAPSYVITDPALQAAELATCHGLLIDGSGSEFSNDHLHRRTRRTWRRKTWRRRTWRSLYLNHRPSGV
jgi:hypothetical protein